jgi:thimet oligopeptidase
MALLTAVMLPLPMEAAGAVPLQAARPTQIDWNLTPEQITSTCMAMRGQRTFTNTLLPLGYLAALLGTAPYETLSGGFRQDFVEAPSQMLENFMWRPAIFKEVSSNATTGSPLPDDLIAKMIAARYVDEAYFTTGQIKLGMVDMAYHSRGPKVDTTAVWGEISSQYTPLAMVPGTHPQAAFGHLFGYDAGYYTYLWALVYAQDMFTAFQSGGLENQAVGLRYRQTILEPARTYESDAEVRAFLGRPMSTDAFYKQFETAPEATPTPKG